MSDERREPEPGWEQVKAILAEELGESEPTSALADRLHALENPAPEEPTDAA